MKDAPGGCEAESLMIIKVVSKVLDQLIAGAKVPTSNLGLFIKFQSSYAPEVSVQSYLERIRKYSRCSDACFVMALIYIDRLIEYRQLMLSQLNVHRLLVTAVMLAAKYHDDLFYNNSYYAKLGGLPLTELNLLEVDFLKLMNFSLFINNDAYDKYYHELKNYLFCVDIVPSPVSIAAPGRTFPSSVAGSRLGGSSSCPNFSNVVAPASVDLSSGVQHYRVPSPHNPHDKAASVNVSNEYYFGGYANAAAAVASASSTCARGSHSSGGRETLTLESADSPEFFDGNELVDYASPARVISSATTAMYGNDSCTSSAALNSVYTFAHNGHQRSYDSVASIPYYLSPVPNQQIVRQVDRQISSWQRSAALMTTSAATAPVIESTGRLQIDTTSCHQQQSFRDADYFPRQMYQSQGQQQQPYDVSYYGANSSSTYSGYHSSGPSTLELGSCSLAHRASAPSFSGYRQESAVSNDMWFEADTPSPRSHSHQQQKQPQQQLHQHVQFGGGFVEYDVPNVVDTNGSYHPSYSSGMNAGPAVYPYQQHQLQFQSRLIPPVGGQYQTYQRQHSL